MISQQSQPQVAFNHDLAFQAASSSSTTGTQSNMNTPVKSSVNNTASPAIAKNVVDWPREPGSCYEETWGRLDRLAFALAKVDLATWEHTRIRDKLSPSSKQELKETDDVIHYFTSRLRKGLLNLGMTRRKIDRILDMCQSQELQRGMRIPVEYEWPSTATDRRVLHDLGFTWRKSKV